MTKQYFEDSSGAPDDTGGHEEVYRYWDYTFDFVERAYRVRIYTDEPHNANVFRQDVGARVPLVKRLRSMLLRRDEVRLADTSERDYLRAIRSHLEGDGWARLNIWILGSDGYVSVPLD